MERLMAKAGRRSLRIRAELMRDGAVDINLCVEQLEEMDQALDSVSTHIRRHVDHPFMPGKPPDDISVD